MKKLAIFIVITLLSVSLSAVAVAKGKPVVIINGGGIVQNNNSEGGTTPELLSVGGFTAREDAFGDFKGQIQSKSTPANDPSITLGSIHGSVVCLLDIGAGVWEVRFRVTEGSGSGLGLVGFHGSIFVLDDGSPGAGNDMIDESFELGSLTNPACGLAAVLDEMSLELVLAGNFTVHD
jgi:hypothetical protein